MTAACPECGNSPVGADEIVLFGWAERGEAVRRRPVAIHYVLALGWAMWLFVEAVSAIFIPEMRFVAPPLLVIAGVIPLGLLLMRRRAAAGKQMEPYWQVRLSAAGYGQREGDGPVELMHWIPNAEIAVVQEAAGIYRLQIDRFGPFGGEDWAARVLLFFRAEAGDAGRLLVRVTGWRELTRGK